MISPVLFPSLECPSPYISAHPRAFRHHTSIYCASPVLGAGSWEVRKRQNPCCQEALIFVASWNAHCFKKTALILPLCQPQRKVTPCSLFSTVYDSYFDSCLISYKFPVRAGRVANQFFFHPNQHLTVYSLSIWWIKVNKSTLTSCFIISFFLVALIVVCL